MMVVMMCPGLLIFPVQNYGYGRPVLPRDSSGHVGAAAPMICVTPPLLELCCVTQMEPVLSIETV
jgi:hypothetical protein